MLINVLLGNDLVLFKIGWLLSGDDDLELLSNSRKIISEIKILYDYCMMLVKVVQF